MEEKIIFKNISTSSHRPIIFTCPSWFNLFFFSQSLNQQELLCSPVACIPEVICNLMIWKKRSYSEFQAYSDSKLANIYFASELDRIFQKANVNVRAYSVHPGIIPTELNRDKPIMSSIFYTIGYAFLNKGQQQLSIAEWHQNWKTRVVPIVRIVQFQ